MGIEKYVSSPVHVIRPDARLADAHARLAHVGVSSLPVVHGDELIGVISRGDLLRVGRRQAGTSQSAALLTLPDQSVADIMTTDVVTVSIDATVASAAAAMCRAGIHRVFAMNGSALAAVFSTRDVMLAIRDARAGAPISEAMSSPIFTIGASEPISTATERLEKARVTGLLVVEADWPVGLFSQVEALESRWLPRNTPVDEVMTPALVCLPKHTRMHRAAGQGNALRVRRVVAVDKREAVGILTGLDFARFAAA